MQDDKETILAKDFCLTMDTWKSKLNNNVMLVGASGRGKTRGFIKPNIMQMNCNYVISDPKGQLIKEVGRLLENNGYTIRILNLINMTHSNTYNPFVYIDEGDYTSMYKLIDFLWLNTRSLDVDSVKADPFWDESGKALLSAICFYLMESLPPKMRTFESIMTLLGHINADEACDNDQLDDLMMELAKKKPDSIAVKQYAVYKAVGRGKTSQCILISVLVRLFYFNMPEYLNLTSMDDMCLDSLSEEKMAIFVLTSDTDRSKNWLAGLFYSQLFDRLCGRENKRHIRFILDDFVCCGRIPDFDYKMAMIRSRNISSIIVIQDEAQLEKIYGRAAKDIITNCDSYVFLGASNIEACEMASKRLSMPGVTAQYIRKMDYSQCLVICGNKGGIYEKYDLQKHPMYPFIADTPDSPYLYDIKYRCGAKNEVDFKSSTVDEKEYLKSSFWDSKEEEYCFYLLSHLPDTIKVFPHQHLKDIFGSNEKRISKKLSYMHCDFVLRNQKYDLICAIEVDGSQHETDIRQMANDSFENDMFARFNIPLLRIKTIDIRNDLEYVIRSIVELLDSVNYKNIKFPTKMFTYYEFINSKELFENKDMLSNHEIEETDMWTLVQHMGRTIRRQNTVFDENMVNDDSADRSETMAKVKELFLVDGDVNMDTVDDMEEMIGKALARIYENSLEGVTSLVNSVDFAKMREMYATVTQTS